MELILKLSLSTLRARADGFGIVAVEGTGRFGMISAICIS